MAKEVESPKSQTFVEQELHEMPSTLGMDSLMPHSPSPKVNPLFVIFYGIVVSTYFNRAILKSSISHHHFQAWIKEILGEMCSVIPCV
jgi:hypothetical protein